MDRGALARLGATAALLIGSACTGESPPADGAAGRGASAGIGGSGGSAGTVSSGGTSGLGGAAASGGMAGSVSSGGATGGATTGGSGGASAGTAGIGGAGTGGVAGASGAGMAGASAAAGGMAGGGAAGDAGSAGATPGVTIPRGGRCAAPTAARVADAEAAFAKWKTDLLTSDGANGALRVRRPNSSGAQVNSTVSEGIAYGMLIAVYMDDQATFDGLWKYALQWLDENGLMHWYINAEGTMPLGTGAASDGDEDMAFAHLMAHERWGGGGSLAESYQTYATRLIGLIWDHEIDHGRGDILTPGDGFADGSVINISYFAPAFFRAFGRASGDEAGWGRSVDASYDAIEAALNPTNQNEDNGLVPAWSTPAGVPTVPPGTSHPIHHQLDSCRTPFRLAQDYCWYGEPRALAYLDKINSFHSSVGALNILDGYDLNGTPHPQFASVGMQSAAFVGPAAVGAMANPLYATLRDEGYTAVAGLNLFAGSQYYNESWTVLSLIMMAGMMDDFSLAP